MHAEKQHGTQLVPLEALLGTKPQAATWVWIQTYIQLENPELTTPQQSHNSTPHKRVEATALNCRPHANVPHALISVCLESQLPVPIASNSTKVGIVYQPTAVTCTQRTTGTARCLHSQLQVPLVYQPNTKPLPTQHKALAYKPITKPAVYLCTGTTLQANRSTHLRGQPLKATYFLTEALQCSLQCFCSTAVVPGWQPETTGNSCQMPPRRRRHNRSPSGAVKLQQESKLQPGAQPHTTVSASCSAS
jgi:hypothetical protein